MAEITELRTAHDGWCKLFVATVRTADGASFTREIEDHGEAVAVLPYDTERRTALLVRQLRAPALHAAGVMQVLEAPAGLADHGSVEDSVRAEAQEELGLTLREVEFIGTAWTMPGISTERMHLYLAAIRAEDRTGAGGGLGSENESIEIVEMPLTDLAALAAAGEIVDMKTFALVMALQLRHPALFR
jgi:nudix-type nucleoside diphosphatase (YffH/AdpP family)